MIQAKERSGVKRSSEKRSGKEKERETTRNRKE